MLEIRLHQIKEILQSDASCEIKTQRKGNDLKTTIRIEDNRFHNIRQLVKQIEQKNNKNYRKLIELISDYIGQIYDKEDFDNGTVCSNYYNYKQKKANDDFANQLFDYICKILKTNPDITLSVEAIENLLRIQQNIISDKLSSPESEIDLINILIKNKTLEKSNISTYQTYQILMKSDRISDQYALPYLITPEQFSFTAEKKLMDAIDTKAVINAEVLTISRMAHRVLQELGGNTKTQLTKCGKSMLIYSILNENKSNLKFLSKSDENIDLSMTAITEFKKHGVLPEDLKQEIDKTDDKYLKTKLNDMFLIYSNFEQKLQGEYIEDTDLLTILSNIIEDTDIVKDSLIYIDEFSGFTYQE